VVGGTARNSTYTKGTSFYSHQSPAFPGSNQAPLTAASQKLQVAILSFLDGSGGTATTLTEIVCLIAEPKSTSSTESSSGGSTSSSSDIAGPTAMAAAGALAMAGLGFAWGVL
jgi:hypothetical protein